MPYRGGTHQLRVGDSLGKESLQTRRYILGFIRSVILCRDLRVTYVTVTYGMIVGSRGPCPLAGQCIVQLESSVVDWNFFKGIGEDSPVSVFLFPRVWPDLGAILRRKKIKINIGW